jgi:YD repeat-containing protein
VCGTAGTPSVSSPGGAGLTGHDETNYGVSSTTCAGKACPRGNVTQKTQLSSTGSPVTTYTYDETGQVLSMIDPCGNAACSDMVGSTHTTTYSYAKSRRSDLLCEQAFPRRPNNERLRLVLRGRQQSAASPSAFRVSRSWRHRHADSPFRLSDYVRNVAIRKRSSSLSGKFAT